MSIADLFDSEEYEWRDHANCLGMDPEVFFPGQGAPTKGPKDVCRECEVTEQCLDFALKEGIRHGIWGGKSERERDRIRRDRRKKLQS